MPPQVKFEIIKATTERDHNLLSINKMCDIAGVSRSGYYNWLNSADKRKQREDKDTADFELILEAYRFRGYKKGARSIYMRLLHQGIVMNLKKIRRLMHKYGLKCPIRGANPYRRLAKALKTSNVAPNIVKRDFFSHGARKVLLTDITYLFYQGGVCYLSPILDAFTREILAYELSDNLRVGFVLQTVDEMIAKYGCTLDDTTIVHSDQGCHYTSLAFIEKLKANGLTQSMSRKGNCLDNSPMENFFGKMKNEMFYGHEYEFKTLEQLQKAMEEYIDYYNNERIQVKLKGLTPCQARNQSLYSF